jgi:hypothetical protein
MLPTRDLRGSLKVLRHFWQRKRSVPFRLTPKRLQSTLQVPQVIVFAGFDSVTMSLLYSEQPLFYNGKPMSKLNYFTLLSSSLQIKMEAQGGLLRPCLLKRHGGGSIAGDSLHLGV